MLENFVYKNMISTPPSSYTGKAQDLPASQVLEGLVEDKDIGFERGAILPSGPLYR